MYVNYEPLKGPDYTHTTIWKGKHFFFKEPRHCINTEFQKKNNPSIVKQNNKFSMRQCQTSVPMGANKQTKQQTKNSFFSQLPFATVK